MSAPQPDTETLVETLYGFARFVPDGYRDDDGVWHDGPHRRTFNETISALAARLAETEARWQEMEHPFDQSEYDAMFARADAAERRVAELREESAEHERAASRLERQVATLEVALDALLDHAERIQEHVSKSENWYAVRDCARAALDSVSSQPAHDDKGFSEEKCVRCGWIMGQPPLNCQNDGTPHRFPDETR